ncbi:unnamed protein product, partial [Amoebophrya sp. A120]
HLYAWDAGARIYKATPKPNREAVWSEAPAEAKNTSGEYSYRYRPVDNAGGFDSQELDAEGQNHRAAYGAALQQHITGVPWALENGYFARGSRRRQQHTTRDVNNQLESTSREEYEDEWQIPRRPVPGTGPRYPAPFRPQVVVQSLGEGTVSTSPVFRHFLLNSY